MSRNLTLGRFSFWIRSWIAIRDRSPIIGSQRYVVSRSPWLSIHSSTSYWIGPLAFSINHRRKS